MRLVPAIATAVCLLTAVGSAKGDGAPVDAATHLVAVDAARGFAVAVGADGAVLTLDRRTRTWKRARPTTQSELRGVSVVSKRHVYAAGIGGYFTQLDRGAWISPPGSTSRSFHGIAFADRKRGIAVGDQGKVRHWVKNAWYDFTAALDKTSLYDVARVGRGRYERFIAVGAHGRAVAFTGVGHNLAATAETTGVDGALTAVASCDGREAEAIAVGAQAVVRGVDGTWRRLPDPPAALRGVVVRCERGAVITAYAATDGGLAIYDAAVDAWRTRPLEGASALNDVAWFDRKQLVAVGARGFAKLIPADEPAGEAVTAKQ